VDELETLQVGAHVATGTEPDGLEVLLIGAYCPYPPRSGWARRTYQLLRQLAARHHVTLLCYADPDEAAEIERLRDELDVEVVVREAPPLLKRRLAQVGSVLSPVPSICSDAQSRAMQRAIDELCARRRFDVIQLESTLVWGFTFPPDALLVLDEHNVDFEVYDRMRVRARSPVRRAFYRWEQLRFRRYEVRAWRDAAGCALTSDREREMVHRLAPGTPAATVPNGVDVDYFSPDPVEVETDTLVFNGVLDYHPNLDAVEFLVQEILPRVRARRPQARVKLVGRGDLAALERFRVPGVEVTGEVPDIRPHLQRAAVIVVPIRMGSGTRFKVVEGLAMAKPMVSTTVGCEGIDVRDGEHLLVADTPDALAAAIVRLLEDPALGAQLGEAGRRLVEDKYSWDFAGQRLDELYRSVVARRAGSRPG
jgi:sugar transferase (PEP-CTERM/EpsH1 system associated)